MKIILFFMFFAINIYADIFGNNKNTEKAGDIVQMFLPFYALGTTLFNEDFKDGSKDFLLTFFLTQGSTELLKRTIKEERPNHSNNLSFPSGHTAASFSVATFIHKRYGLKQAVLPYILASYVGYTRVKTKKHYFHDVAAGAAISAIFTYFIVDEHIGVDVSKNSFLLTYNYTF